MFPGAGGSVWTCTWRLPLEQECTIRYHYSVYTADVLVRTEPPTASHTLTIARGTAPVVTVFDRWVEPSAERRLRQGFRVQKAGDLLVDRLLTLPCTEGSCYFVLPSEVWAHEGDEIRLVGSTAATGQWDVERGLPLFPIGETLAVKVPAQETFEYKWVYRYSDGSVVWEEGGNRLFTPSADLDRRARIEYVEPPRWASCPRQSVPQKVFGTAVPLFSLRTERSYGCGDLSDALTLLQWLHETGQGLLQLLPIYDTTWSRTDRDSYPYNCITTYGIHPLYLDVRQLYGYDRSAKRAHWEERAARLNALDAVDYCAVMELKEEVIDHCFERWYASESKSEEFRSFCSSNDSEVIPYALFCVLRDRHPAADVREYPSYEESLAQWRAHGTLEGTPAVYEVYRYLYIQYALYRQLAELRKKADAWSILLKGDLPIGVGRNSVDVWQDPTLFHLDYSAGAPPDPFSQRGQDWGFPTYNWQVMLRDGYRWWKRRMEAMSSYFSAVRVDHVLGFFRIWSIPYGSLNPCVGHFVPAMGYEEDEVAGLCGAAEIRMWKESWLCVHTAEEIWGRDLPLALTQGWLSEAQGGYLLKRCKRSDIPPGYWSTYAESLGECLFVVDESGLWHPRILLERTHRFGELPSQIQSRLRALHDDYYYRRNEQLWKSTALERLEALVHGTGMLICAEDLGMLPASVPEVLGMLEIFSLEVLRMSKRSDVTYVRPCDIPRLSVLTTSTHDMPSLRGWWCSLDDQQRSFICREYGLDPPGESTLPLLLRSLSRTNASVVIFPLQDWFVLSGYAAEVSVEDEQINYPHDSEHVWDYRMYRTIEDLRHNTSLSRAVRELTAPSSS